jgi:hypothetical protein
LEAPNLKAGDSRALVLAWSSSTAIEASSRPPAIAKRALRLIAISAPKSIAFSHQLFSKVQIFEFTLLADLKKRIPPRDFSKRINLKKVDPRVGSTFVVSND